MRINIPNDLVDAIDKYVATHWEDGRDPSKLGALNAVAYIGERLLAVVSSARQGRVAEAETDLETARKAHRHAAHVYAGVKGGPNVEARRRAAAAQLERAGVAVTIALAVASAMDDA